MVGCASVFSQLIAIFSRRQFHELVVKHRAERYARKSTPGIISWPFCSAKWLKPRACERFAEDWLSAWETEASGDDSQSEQIRAGSRLLPPKDFPEKDWIEFSLNPAEVETKRRALLQYSTQMLVMGRFLLSFARSNELFWLEPTRSEEDIKKVKCCE